MADFPKMGERLLSEKVKDLLFKMIKEGSFDDTGRLPPESELSSKMAVSRTVIRDVYSLLENEGYITRRRGIGTIINYNVLRVKVRLDIDYEYEFYDLVRESGHIPDSEFIVSSEVKATGEIMNQLKLAKGETVVLIERLITADKEPVIYCKNYFPKTFLIKSTFESLDIKRPIFEFLDKFCSKKIHLEIATVQPILLTKKIMKIFKIRNTEPVLLLEETAYDIEQKPVLYSEEYHRTGILKHTLLRKRV